MMYCVQAALSSAFCQLRPVGSCSTAMMAVPPCCPSSVVVSSPLPDSSSSSSPPQAAKTRARTRSNDQIFQTPRRCARTEWFLLMGGELVWDASARSDRRGRLLLQSDPEDQGREGEDDRG